MSVKQRFKIGDRVRVREGVHRARVHEGVWGCFPEAFEFTIGYIDQLFSEKLGVLYREDENASGVYDAELELVKSAKPKVGDEVEVTVTTKGKVTYVDSAGFMWEDENGKHQPNLLFSQKYQPNKSFIITKVAEPAPVAKFKVGDRVRPNSSSPKKFHGVEFVIGEVIPTNDGIPAGSLRFYYKSGSNKYLESGYEPELELVPAKVHPEWKIGHVVSIFGFMIYAFNGVNFTSLTDSGRRHPIDVIEDYHYTIVAEPK